MPIKTLGNYHKNYIKKFNKKEKDNVKLEKQYLKTEKDFNNLDKKSKKDMTDAEIKKYFILKEKLETLTNNIENNKLAKSEYYINAFDPLYNYYHNGSNAKKEQSIMDFFSNKTNETALNKVIDSKTITNKKDILENFLETVDENFIGPENYVANYTICSNCKKEKALSQNQSIYICKNCGEFSTTMIISEKQNYLNIITENTNYSYRRINHFLEWIDQFQAREKTLIPPEIFKKIINEISKEKKLKLNDITCAKMREILERLHLSKYYDHVNFILNKITDKPAPKFEKELEKKLIFMFKQIQEPFEKHKTKNRKNFFSYPYCIKKFLELLEEDKFVSLFNYLKSREKLAKHDQTWKLICADLKWEFIPSI